jgi:DNA-binding LytR/AlgR family response regulator
MNTILLVEDDIAIREMIRKFLELNHFAVITTSNGKEGLLITQKTLPDIIISDVIMPGMDGFEMKRELGKNELTSTIPFIFLTSKSQVNDFRKGMELGADDYLFKPVVLEDLKKIINIQLAKREKLLKRYISESKKDNKKEVLQGNHVLIKDRGIPRFIRLDSIAAILAEDKYSKVILENNEKIISTYTLKGWEKILTSKNFVRIHRTAIINIDFIDKVDKWFQRGYKVTLKKIPGSFEISRRYYSRIIQLYKGEL